MFDKWLTLLFSTLLICASVVSGEDRPGRPEAPWKELERELISRGVKTDTASLLETAGSHLDSDLRWMAIEVLGLRKEETAKPLLWQLIGNDEDRLVRETAAVALAHLGDARGLKALRSLMDSAEMTERKLFLAARLAEQGDPSGYPYVVEAVKSEDARTRFLSVAGLVPFVPLQKSGKVKGVDPTQDFLDLAQDKASEVRYEVLVQMPLATQKGAPVERFKPTVQKMAAEDQDPEVREKAKLLLILWGAR